MIERDHIHRSTSAGNSLSTLFFPPAGQHTRASSVPAYLPDHDLTRQEFEQYVRARYGVTDVHTGTQNEQEQRLTRHNMPAQTIQGWQTWDPGIQSADYTSIVLGIEDMLRVFGAMPQLKTILFFHQAYDPSANGIATPAPDTGASFGAGEMTIFQNIHRSSILPVNRVTAPGSGAPVRFAYGDRSQYIRQNITHELGHGVAEAAMASQNNQTFDQFKLAVGWVGTNPEVLFDIGQPAVLAAIAANTTPPAQHMIGPSRWNDDSVVEQPMSRYSVEGQAAEDFAESIMAYIHQNAALLQRSPRRHAFIRMNLSQWLSRMRMIAPAVPRPPVGDFPEPAKDKMFA
jgi:hypothetical protein